MLELNRVYVGPARTLATSLAPQSIDTIVTSPPYWGLRSYLPADHPWKGDELGAERTPAEYVANLVAVFRALRPMLRDDGTLWLNLGDAYCTRSASREKGNRDVIQAMAGEKELPTWKEHARQGRVRYSSALKGEGLKDKDLIGLPWMVAFALRADGWIVRSDIIWAKKNCMPESVRDRPTRSHEHIFLLSKSARYYYDAAAIAEPLVKGAAGPTFTNGKTGVNGLGRVSQLPREDASTRNKRDVWHVSTAGYPEAHYATFPPELIRPCVLAGCRPGGVVLDPFIGSGTTAQVATEEGRSWIGFDLDDRSAGFTARRLAKAEAKQA